MRIVSLLPSATEIVCALGAASELVGISHECDHPASIAHLPRLTRARVGGADSAAIDRSVRDLLRSALAVYDIELEALASARPDVIVTQDLCDVCAVSLEDVRAAVARLFAAERVPIVNLHPTRLSDIWADIERTGRALDRDPAPLVTALRARVDDIARRAATETTRPAVLTIEWISPVMIGGTWMPELVALAGGTPMVSAPGDHAPTLDRAALEAFDPDVVVVKPCGFDLARTERELASLPEMLPWDRWRAVREGRVYVADGNAFFNRPGPRIVESLEILAACVHPAAFADHARAHAADAYRLDATLARHAL